LENSDLDSNQKEKFLAFLGKNRNVFAKDLSEFSGLVTLLTLRKSIVKRKVPHFFLTRTTGLLHSEFDGSIMFDDGKYISTAKKS
jgi:hypothetical protein